MCNNRVPVSIALILFLFYQAWPDKGFGVLCLWWKLREIPFYVFNWHLLAGEAWICFCKGVLEEFCTDSSILISPSQIFCHSIFHQACSFLDLSYYFNSGANWDIKPWSLFSCICRWRWHTCPFTYWTLFLIPLMNQSYLSTRFNINTELLLFFAWDARFFLLISHPLCRFIFHLHVEEEKSA